VDPCGYVRRKDDVLAVAAAAFVLAFAPRAGWTAGASGTTHSAYGGTTETAAWTAYRVRYRDRATNDPPNATLKHLPRGAVVVWAVAFKPANHEPPIRLALRYARHLPCCEGEFVAGGEWELAGRRNDYSVIVRIYFGSPPTRAMRRQAADALTRLRLP
jgi:hypothetical protein